MNAVVEISDREERKGVSGLCNTLNKVMKSLKLHYHGCTFELTH